MTARHCLSFLLAVAMLLAATPANAQYAPPGPGSQAAPAYPPPAYYPPPGYYYPPPAPLEEVVPTGENAPFRRGFLVMPYVGSHIPFGDGTKGYKEGVRFGTFLGGHLNSMLSLAGEVTMDLQRPSGNADSYAGVMFDFAFSPLVHVPMGGLEFVVGPKLGTFVFTESARVLGLSYHGDGYGYAYGGTVGLLGAVGRLAIGGLIGFTGRSLTHACGTINGMETCTDSPTGTDYKAISLTAAFLF